MHVSSIYCRFGISGKSMGEGLAAFLPSMQADLFSELSKPSVWEAKAVVDSWLWPVILREFFRWYT